MMSVTVTRREYDVHMFQRHEVGLLLIAVLLATDASAQHSLESAQLAFYNARYEAAAAQTLEPCNSSTPDLEACELRTAALLFQMKRLVGQAADKDKAWQQCESCPGLMTAFKATLLQGQTLARARLAASPNDDETLFLLGKLDLNHVWLHLGTLGRKTGWSEYWEARKALDQVLERQPGHVRARVARGWIDYIVDTRLPMGTRWLLGGGNKKRGIEAIRSAADTDAEFFTRTEARFGLWDIQVREKDMPAAVATARILVRDFPENVELRKFIETNASASAAP
jgi:hypothetical protein